MYHPMPILGLQYCITFILATAIVVGFSIAFKCKALAFLHHDKFWILMLGLVGFFCGVSDSINEIFWQHLRIIDSLPLELCGFSYTILLPLALISRSTLLQQTLLYWGVVGGVLSYLFPTLSTQINFEYIRYYIAHGALFLGSMYVLFVHKVPVTKLTFLKAWFMLQGFFICILIFDLVFHTNYFFLLHKPNQSTPLNEFGPWPYYLIPADILFFVVFFILGLLFNKANNNSH